jgi:tRNA (guanosine-2'-O-)-methyltransferase
MRRTTPGVLGAEELIGPRIARAEAHDPSRVVRVLEPMVTEARRARLREVIARRLASVAVVLDGPYDPHNGAAVVRSCEAFGVQKLHVVEQPNIAFAVARSVSRGAEKWVDLVRHKQPPSAIAWAREHDMPLVGAHPEGELSPEQLANLPRVALVLGNEREGIRDEIARACTARVRVPMRGFVESLNMSVTAAVLLYAATLGRPGDLDEASRLRLYARGLFLTIPKAEDVLAHAPDDGPG